MNLRNITALVGALLLALTLVPGRTIAAPRATHSPEYQKMKAAMDELAQKTGQEFEVAYINSIIPHHQGAIAMAQTVVNEAPHQEVRASAAKIIADQQKEIEELSAYLKDWYGQAVQPDARMQMSPQMMDMLKQADSAMREKLFLAMMREHHQSAIDMGPIVLKNARHAELKEQAQRMVTSQQQEQAMFGGWLQGLYAITPPVPTGDMQDGMEAVMPMSMPAASPAAPAANAPSTLPNTAGESPFASALLAAALVALLAGSVVLRRARG